MDKVKPKILVIVEGAKAEVRLMEHLFHIYDLDATHQIVSYKTNIYALYNAMFSEGEPEYLEILQVLKEREQDKAIKPIFDERYTDILLIFDLEPHDPQFSEEKILQMTNYFSESTEMGKLYINYPMVEAFYHMSSIPDLSYWSRYVCLSELKERTYKRRVNAENRNHDYSKFAINREECGLVIRQNIEKSWSILGKEILSENAVPAFIDVLEKQLDYLREKERVFVLCTCAFFILDYNPSLLN